jgi:hypothetical protein
MTRISKTLLAGAVVAGLGALTVAQPANAAIATYDLVFSTPVGTSATGSISLDTGLLSGNSTCGFAGGCGFTGFAAIFDLDGWHFAFGPGDVNPLDLTVTAGVPTALFLSTPQSVPSAEDVNDYAGLTMAEDGWSLQGVIDGFEFNLHGEYSFAAQGGGDPDPVGVPEPGTLLLFGAGLAGAALMRRKRVSAA